MNLKIQQTAKSKRRQPLQKLHAEEKPRFHARLFQKGQLLGENARPAEGHGKRAGGQGKGAPARGEQGAAVRGLQKSRGQAVRTGFGL